MREKLIGLSAAAAALALAGGLQSWGGAEAQESAWEHPRTAWGDPDLQGMWPIINLISTPFQRPVDEKGNLIYGDRELLTDEEYAATEQRLAARDARYQEEIQSQPQQRCGALDVAARRAERRPISRAHGARQGARLQDEVELELHGIRQAH